MYQKIGVYIALIVLLGAGCASGEQKSEDASVDGEARDTYVSFSLNMQDFAYPDESAAVLRKALELHEKYAIPVDVFLTGTIAKYYAEHAPDIIEQLKASPVAAVSYHVRPPAPYTNDFDWYGLGSMSEAEQYSVIMEYETHDIDLVTGQSLNAVGGYQLVKELIGYAPYAAGIPSSAGLTAAVDKAMVALGAQMDIVHSNTAMNLGDKKNGLFIRPETIDLKLFEHSGEDGADILRTALAQAPAIAGAQVPYFVNVKMHDNDFFATASAWTTVYLARGTHRRPPFDLSLKAPLLDDATREAIWQQYESMLESVQSQKNDLGSVNIPQILLIEPK